MASSGKGGSKGSGGGGGGSGSGINIFAGQDVTKILALSGGAMVGAAVLFGVKKIYDYYVSSGPVTSGTPLTTPVTTPEYIKAMPDVVPEEAELVPRIEVTCEGEEGVKEAICDSPESISVESPLASPDSEGSSLQSPSHTNTLYKQLVLFHSDICSIPQQVLAVAQEVRDLLMADFECYITDLLPNMPVRPLHSAAFDPQVVAVRQVEIRIPLDINEDLWHVVDAGDSILAAHGYCFVKRGSLEFFSPGSSRYDRFLVAGYLNPTRIREIFHDLTHRASKWNTDLQVKAAVVGNIAQLAVTLPDGEPLQVNFVPEIRLGNTTVIAEAHPITKLDKSYENLWRCCYGDATLQRLQENHGCQFLCLQSLLGLQHIHPLVGELGPMVPTATILHQLSQEEDWSDEALSERFIDSLKFIEGCCRKREMLHPLRGRWNLLKHVRPTCLTAVAGLIQDVIENKSYDWFLQADWT